MKQYLEPQKQLDVLLQTEVLVVGGGPAGISAAIASARQGADTLLIERYGCFGGVITHVGVEAIAWYRHEGLVNEAGGFLYELERKAQELGASVKECQSDSRAIDPELFKWVCDKMLLEAGVKVLLHSYVVGAIVEDGVIRGVVIESKSGRQAIEAKRVIDCSGDADVVKFAGAPFTIAPKNELMAATQLFSCQNVDNEKFLNYVMHDLKPTYSDWGGECWAQQIDGQARQMFSPYIEKPFVEARKDGSMVIDDPDTTIGGTWSTLTPNGDVTQLNLVFMNNVDSTDVRDLTRAEIKGRDYCIKAIKVLNERVPGFEKAKLRKFGMTLGTRESRQLDGLYRLKKEDVFEQARFEDSIAIFPEFIDGRSYLVLPLTGRYYQIPYRVLVPKKIDNLLVAGRCISGDPIAQTSFRNMACCVATGQGAGTAAALSLRQNVTTSCVDIKSLQTALKKEGVRID